MAYSEQTFNHCGTEVTLKSWLSDTDYAEGFQQYYVTRKYVAWTTRRVLASQVYIIHRQSELKALISDLLGNVMTVTVTVKSQQGVRLYLPRQDRGMQQEVLAYLADMGITPRQCEDDSPTPQADETRNVNNWWNDAEYRRKLKKAEQELERHGHAATISFKVGRQEYEVVSNGQITKVVKQRARQV